MRKVNFSEPKITLRLTPALKRKAARMAGGRGLSISQLVEDLLRHASADPLSAEMVRGIVNDELKKKALTIEIIRVIIQEELKRALKPSCFYPSALKIQASNVSEKASALSQRETSPCQNLRRAPTGGATRIS